SSTETSAFHPTHNPWDLERVPGGSSGGSAAAVAAGLVCASLGSDTGGSIRQPASFCGVVGIKPTYGVVSRYGVVAFGSSLDQVGPFARSVEDAAFVLEAIAGRDPLDCTSQEVSCDFVAAAREGARGLSGMRVGVVPEFMEAKGLSPEVKAKVLAAMEALRNAGADIVEVDLPNVHAAISAYYVLAPCEAFSNLARFDSVRYGLCAPDCADLGHQYEASRRAGFGPEARRRIMLGGYLLGAGVYDRYYYPAQQIRTLITRDYAEAFEKVDVILAPVAPRTAFRFGEVSDPTEMYLSDMFTISINIAGNGGMSVPVGLGEDSGLPVGVQLICPAFKDANMIRAAAAVEAAFGRLGIAPAFEKTPDGSRDGGWRADVAERDSSASATPATGPAATGSAPSPEGGAR
ncbi:MAG: aspartyl/glutamyl-tRNA amidotransferase subunit A, partial [Eggerthellaceae bacterium]|nr:aspartyl/glutamyl-tRNA amidotransferase subunit A [Eggerthellaceae bacterium]